MGANCQAFEQSEHGHSAKENVLVGVLSENDNTPASPMPIPHYTALQLHGDNTPDVPFAHPRFELAFDLPSLPGTPQHHCTPQEDDRVPCGASERGNHIQHGHDTGSGEQVLAERLAAKCQLACLSDVKLQAMLCSTNKSNVFKGKWQNKEVAAKLVKDLPSDPESQEVREISTKEMLHEMEILSALRHPSLISFLGGSVDDTFMLFEYMEGGDVEMYMQEQRAKAFSGTYKPPLTLGLQWCTSLASALNFLHGQACQIIHRDLKPMNLLLSRNLELKLTDFGISKVLVCEDTEPAPEMTGGVGTWRYMAPEVVRYEKYTDRIDIYAFSLIMYFILTGKQPFEEMQDPELILKAYLRGKEPRPRAALHLLSQDLRQVMQDAWAVQASARPSAKECLGRLEVISYENKMSSDAKRQPGRWKVWSKILRS